MLPARFTLSFAPTCSISAHCYVELVTKALTFLVFIDAHENCVHLSTELTSAYEDHHLFRLYVLPAACNRSHALFKLLIRAVCMLC